jgi:hypothetical protein
MHNVELHVCKKYAELVRFPSLYMLTNILFLDSALVRAKCSKWCNSRSIRCYSWATVKYNGKDVTPAKNFVV